MEKGVPHCRLSVVKTLTEAGKVRVTASALAGAAMLGFDRAGMLDMVLLLTPQDFYKSMTTHADHTIWQDVTARVRFKLMRSKVDHRELKMKEESQWKRAR